MTIPGLLGEQYRTELFAGLGCCSNLNSWRREALQDRTKLPQKLDIINPIPSIMQKFLKALGSQWISGDSLYLACAHFESLLVQDGMSKNEARATANKALRMLSNHRSGMADQMMGDTHGNL